MGLTPEQRRRVAAALAAGPWDSEMARRLEALGTPEELHQFALNYNCNDGLHPVRFVIRSDLCDRGTALYEYWQFADCIWTPPEERRSEPDERWDAGGLLVEIERRYASGVYTRQEIGFDPRDHLGWNRIDEYKFRNLQERGSLPFPPLMLEATSGRRIEQEWL